MQESSTFQFPDDDIMKLLGQVSSTIQDPDLRKEFMEKWSCDNLWDIAPSFSRFAEFDNEERLITDQYLWTTVLDVLSTCKDAYIMTDRIIGDPWCWVYIFIRTSKSVLPIPFHYTLCYLDHENRDFWR